MNERTLDILDQSLTLSLWTFLVAFIVVLLFVNQRLRARKQGLMEPNEMMPSSFYPIECVWFSRLLCSQQELL